MAPITGQYLGEGLLHLEPLRSRLRFRVPAVDIPHVLPLAGKGLDVMGHRIRLGAPGLQALSPVPSLIARTVTFKHATEVGPFLETARRHLTELGIGGDLQVPTRLAKNGQVEPHRHVLRVKEACIICFSLLVEGLTPDESLRLQEVGLGGKRHMGGGVFVPARNGEEGS
jgi:CRISPR-associated protein Cas6